LQFNTGFSTVLTAPEGATRAAGPGKDVAALLALLTLPPRIKGSRRGVHSGTAAMQLAHGALLCVCERLW
jgi:hypothetical protein